ncbi:MAG: NUDIX hydrolase [Dehalococcoidia bacterium]|nr:NUDIX hydrolase [Dehalococcoidia bacterium]
MSAGSTETVNSNHIDDSPRARCVASVLIKGDRVLLVKRQPHRRVYPDLWDLPGGHIEGNESPEEALRREAREELGIDVEEYHELGTVLDPVEPADIIVFAITTWHGEPTNAAPDEHSEIDWFTQGKLPESAALDCYRKEVTETLTAART